MQVCRQSKAPLIKMKMQRNAATDFGFVRVGRETKKDREKEREGSGTALVRHWDMSNIILTILVPQMQLEKNFRQQQQQQLAPG